ncbi:MAG TPA: VCBS repeat-containing protein, partial [bacterium]|nr:VCBS repeat-containing protein [bacterium]
MRGLLNRLLSLPLVLALAAAAPAGVVVDDFTGDGPLDLVVSEDGAIRLLALEKGGAATDVTEQHGLDGVTGVGELRAVDADDDGRLDLLVLPAAADGALRLLIRDDEDRFRDATERAGLSGVTSAIAAAFSDLDLDGKLDLLVGTSGGDAPPVRVWKGAGNGTFQEITASAGITADAPCMGIAVGDVDFDDLPDVYLSLDDAPNALWRNTGGGSFAAAENAAVLAAPG